jgi:hypothetical protein
VIWKKSREIKLGERILKLSRIKYVINEGGSSLLSAIWSKGNRCLEIVGMWWDKNVWVWLKHIAYLPPNLMISLIEIV